MGRSFTADEEEPGRGQVAVLNHGAWQRRFGGEPDVLDRTVSLNQNDFQIVGVMPASFQLPSDWQSTNKAELYVPLPRRPRLNWGSHYLTSVARLEPNANLEQARAEIGTLVGRLAQQRPDAYPAEARFSVEVIPLGDDLVSNIRPALLLLLGAVGLVLLIACANVANLLLARAAAREREFAIRAALGAGRRRLLRQLLSESLLLALLSGTAGLLLAGASFDLIVAFSPSTVIQAAQIQLDSRVLLFTGAVSLVTAFLFGLGPAWQVSTPELNLSLREGGRSHSPGLGRQHLQRALVVAEVSLAVVLVIGAGLLLRSFLGLLQIDPGFDPRNLLTAQLSLPSSRYPENRQVMDFYSQLLKDVESLPGVSSAAAVRRLPLRGFGGDAVFDIEGRPPAQENLEAYGGIFPHLGYRPVTPDFFRTLGIRLLRGRVFDEFDREDAPLVAIINETMAQRIFADEDPLGQRLRLHWSVEQRGPWVEIVGIVAHTKINSLNEERKEEIFIPAAQTVKIESSNLPGRVAE
ncbi:MAG: ABC transporter permease, partial [Terriglobia bacterium]